MILKSLLWSIAPAWAAPAFAQATAAATLPSAPIPPEIESALRACERACERAWAANDPAAPAKLRRAGGAHRICALAQPGGT